MHFVAIACSSSLLNVLTLATISMIITVGLTDATSTATSLLGTDIMALSYTDNQANATNGWPIHCYLPHEAPSAQPSIELDCIMAAYEILLVNQADVPVQWHTVRPATASYIARRVHGICAITFGALTSASNDLFPLMLIARQAAHLVSNCIRQPTSWRGGESLVGPKGQYWVNVERRGGSVTGIQNSSTSHTETA